MSADNGIYILQSKDGWRVVHAQCIDNLYWWEVPGEYFECGEPKRVRRDELSPQAIADYFGKCVRLNSEYEAMEHAKVLYDEIMDDDFCPIIEYGISYIEGYEYKEFPTELMGD